MNNILYWGVFLSPEARQSLLSSISPIHPNIYADHMTIVFNPSDGQNKYMGQYKGTEVSLSASLRAMDDKGDAVIVSGFEVLDGRTPHITISCANGVKPFYSNELISKGSKQLISTINISGVIGAVEKR